MPPSPWIGSMKTATTFLLCAATWRTASRSFSGTRTKPCTSGSKPACTLRLAVADSVASERPWKAFSMTMMAGSAMPRSWPYLRATLMRGLVRLQPGIAEEHLVQAGDRRDAVGGLLLQRHLEQVRAVDDAADLLGERAHEARVVVAERVHRDAGERIEVLLAGLVPQPHALAAHERDRLAGVGVHDMAHGVAPFARFQMQNGGRRTAVFGMLMT